MFARDPRDIRSPLAVYLAREAAVRHVQVPGDHRLCPVGSDTARNSSGALVYWFIRLHEHFFSVNVGAPLELCDFCIDHSGSLKGTMALLHKLVPLVADPQRVGDMSRLSGFIRHFVFQTQPALVVVPLPLYDVEHLLGVLANFTPGQYLSLKSQPALQDAIGQSSLFTKLNGLLMSMISRGQNTVMTNICNTINTRHWVLSGVSNVFLHHLMRFSGGVNIWPKTLESTLRRFLSSRISSTVRSGEGCLKTRRNGESHLLQDYCGTAAGEGTEEGLRAAIAAIIVKRPALAQPPPYNFQALGHWLSAPFTVSEADAIATAIVDALQLYGHSKFEAEAAATAAARFLAMQNNIRTSFQGAAFQQQQQLAAAAAAQAAQAVVLPAQPLVARNMFDVKDIWNMFTLMEPRLLCLLHEEMFRAGELQNLEWHWDPREIHL